MIRKHTRRAAKAAFAISLGVAIVIGVYAAAFTRPAHATTKTSPTIIIGTKNFGEEYILGQLYKQALEAKGFTVSYKENIGATELDDLRHCEREDQLLSRVHGRDRPGRVPSRERRRRRPRRPTSSRRRSRPPRATRRLNATPFYDTDVVVVTNAYAKKYGLKSIGDLKKAGCVQVRRFPDLQDAEHLPRRVHEAVRPHEGVVRSAVRDRGRTRRSTPARSWRRTGSRPTRRSAKPSKYMVLADPKHVTGFQNVAADRQDIGR